MLLHQGDAGKNAGSSRIQQSEIVNSNNLAVQKILSRLISYLANIAAIALA